MWFIVWWIIEIYCSRAIAARVTRICVEKNFSGNFLRYVTSVLITAGAIIRRR